MNWRDLSTAYPQIFDSLWLFPKRGEGGDSKFHGGFIPQVAKYLMLRYTQTDNWVLDPFAGSGTTGDVAKGLGRHCFMSDLSPTREDIFKADARHLDLREEPVCDYPVPISKSCDVYPNFRFDLAILHPPYADIIRFSGLPEDLSNCSDLSVYLQEMWNVAVNIDQYVKPKGFVALVLGDIYKDGQVVPLSFLIMQQWRTRLPYKLCAVYIKDIQGNIKDNTENLWKYRHFKNGTNAFRHEYIFVFRKQGGKKPKGGILAEPTDAIARAVEDMVAQNLAFRSVIEDLLEQHRRQIDMEDCGRRCLSKFPEWDRAWDNAEKVLIYG